MKVLATAASCLWLISNSVNGFVQPINGFASLTRENANQIRMVSTPVDKLGPAEITKLNSQGLRFPLVDELQTDNIYINQDAYLVLKFHGSYQQDNRDNRKRGQEKEYSFMLRLKMPAGECTPELYRTLDDLSRDYGINNLRATTRQTFQIHGVMKGDLKHVIKTIMKVGSHTVGGCGDINRNVNCTPAPLTKKSYQDARKYSKVMAELFKPSGSAFSDIWFDGEKAATVEYWRKDIEDEFDIDAMRAEDNKKGIILDHPEEPIYGDLYLPKKYKMGVTVAGDNSIDIYTNDVGLILISDEAGETKGFNVVVGGGMGRTHNKEHTFARAATDLGFIRKENIHEATKAILAALRDHGNREIRMNGRLKYLVHTLGEEKFRDLVQSYMDSEIEPPHPMPEWKYSDWMGWHEQGDGKWFLGFNIEQGRIKDEGDLRLKTGLRKIVDKYNQRLIMSPTHNIILPDIAPEDKADIESILKSHGVKMIEEVDPLVRLSMACPALPLCTLAVTEAERVMPDFMERIRGVLNKVGLEEQEIMIRMTGCPNGCARPYMAELSFVGDGPNTYQVWVGGSPVLTRVGYPLMDKMKAANLEATMEPLLKFYKLNRMEMESFGDFCHRAGKDALDKLF
mmetsp:Transcript_20156/g.25425  ORF Transcript_20156/g.25425 Transcript_20156/m.25425 type:complete len:625 (-) Transcript_20156:177-2051(-)